MGEQKYSGNSKVSRSSQKPNYESKYVCKMAKEVEVEEEVEEEEEEEEVEEEEDAEEVEEDEEEEIEEEEVEEEEEEVEEVEEKIELEVEDVEEKEEEVEGEEEEEVENEEEEVEEEEGEEEVENEEEVVEEEEEEEEVEEEEEEEEEVEEEEEEEEVEEEGEEEVVEEEEEEEEEEVKEESRDEKTNVEYTVEEPQKVMLCVIFDKEQDEIKSCEEPTRTSEKQLFEELTEAYGQQKIVQVEPEEKSGCCKNFNANSSTKMVDRRQLDFQGISSKKRKNKWDVKEGDIKSEKCGDVSRKKKSKWPINDSQINPPDELNEDCKEEKTFKEPEVKLSGCINLTADSSTKVVDGKQPAFQESRSKRRQSKWDVKEEGNNQSEECSDLSIKRRKSRWSDNDSQFNIPVGETDAEIQELYVQLLDINEKMQSGLVDSAELAGQKQIILSKIVQKKLGIPTQLNFQKHINRKYFKKLYVPVEEYPEYNFVGLILGPCGNTQKKMETESGASIKLRGRDSRSKEKMTSQSLPADIEDLHVHIEADNKHSLNTAVAMVEKLLIPVNDGENKHKQSQLIELAKLRGTLREPNCNAQKPLIRGYDGENEHKINKFTDICASKDTLRGQKCTIKSDPCDVCGDAKHYTSKCPLIAQTQANSISSSTIPTTSSNTEPRVNKPKKKIDYANLFVGFLPRTVDDNKLIELFQPFGPLSQVKVVKEEITNISRGYGFVRYVDHISAANAISHMNGYQIDGKRLAVRIAGIPETKPQPAPPPSYPGPASAAPNDPNLLHWPGPPESRPSPAYWPGPPESILHSTAAVQNSSNPVYSPVSSDWWSQSTVAVHQSLNRTSWAGPSDSWLPSTAISSFSAASSLPVHNSAQYSGSLGYSYQNTESSSILSSNSGASDQLANFPGYLKSIDFAPTLDHQHTPSKDLTASVFSDLSVSPKSSYSSLFHYGRSFAGYPLPPS